MIKNMLNYLSRLIGIPKKAALEHSVIVKFNYGNTDLNPLFELEDNLESAILKAKVGELDGHDIAMDASCGSYYMYGTDADALFNIVKPILKSVSFTKNSLCILRYGSYDEDVLEKEIKL